MVTSTGTQLKRRCFEPEDYSVLDGGLFANYGEAAIVTGNHDSATGDSISREHRRTKASGIELGTGIEVAGERIETKVNTGTTAIEKAYGAMKEETGADQEVFEQVNVSLAPDALAPPRVKPKNESGNNA